MQWVVAAVAVVAFILMWTYLSATTQIKVQRSSRSLPIDWHSALMADVLHHAREGASRLSKPRIALWMRWSLAYLLLIS